MSWMRAPWKPRSAKTASPVDDRVAEQGTRLVAVPRKSSGRGVHRVILIHRRPNRNGHEPLRGSTREPLDPAPRWIDPRDPLERRARRARGNVSRRACRREDVADDEAAVRGEPRPARGRAAKKDRPREDGRARPRCGRPPRWPRPAPDRARWGTSTRPPLVHARRVIQAHRGGPKLPTSFAIGKSAHAGPVAREASAAAVTSIAGPADEDDHVLGRAASRCHTQRSAHGMAVRAERASTVSARSDDARCATASAVAPLPSSESRKERHRRRRATPRSPHPSLVLRLAKIREARVRAAEHAPPRPAFRRDCSRRSGPRRSVTR